MYVLDARAGWALAWLADRVRAGFPGFPVCLGGLGGLSCCSREGVPWSSVEL
jgi:hypothetical protein